MTVHSLSKKQKQQRKQRLIEEVRLSKGIGANLTYRSDHCGVEAKVHEHIKKKKMACPMCRKGTIQHVKK